MSKVEFNRKKTSVLPELRPLYKIASILLILKLCCSGSKSSLLKLHLFNWALLDESRMLKLEKSAEMKMLIMGVWGIDPSLNMALNYAVSEGLVERLNNGAFKLSNKGNEFIDKAEVMPQFDVKVASLSKVSKRITEKMVVDAAKRWTDEV